VPYDNASSATFTAAVGVSWTHVTGGSDRYLQAGASRDDGSGFAPTPSGTYAGAALDLLFNALEDIVALVLLEKVAPAAGSNTVALSWSGGATGVAFARSHTGIDQATPHGAEDRATGTGGTITNTHASASGKEVIDVVVALDSEGDTDATASGDNTERLDVNLGAGQPGVLLSDAPGAASVAMDWDLLSNPTWISSVYSLNPAGAGASPPRLHFRRGR